MNGEDWLQIFGAGGFVALMSYLSTRVTARTDLEKTKAEANAKLQTEMLSADDIDIDTIRQLWSRVDEQAGQIMGLQEQVIVLRLESGTKDGKIRAFIRHVHAWRQKCEDQSKWPWVPHEIREDLDPSA